MTGGIRRRLSLRGRPLFAGMSTASLATAVGVAVNVATELADNPFAWTAVAVTTLASGGTAAWISKTQSGSSTEVIEETTDEDIPRRLRSEKRSTSRRVSKGI